MQQTVSWQTESGVVSSLEGSTTAIKEKSRSSKQQFESLLDTQFGHSLE